MQKDLYIATCTIGVKTLMGPVVVKIDTQSLYDYPTTLKRLGQLVGEAIRTHVDETFTLLSKNMSTVEDLKSAVKDLAKVTFVVVTFNAFHQIWYENQPSYCCEEERASLSCLW